MAFIDDTWDCARSRTKAIRDAQLAVNLLHRLGFGIHLDKVQVDPTQSIGVLDTQVKSVNVQFLVPRSEWQSLFRKCFDTCCSIGSTSSRFARM